MCLFITYDQRQLEVCVCIFSFTAHGTVCTFVVHEYNMTRWTFLTVLFRSQIVLSKMFTTQGMYNYSANSILSNAWCGVLAFSGALKSATLRVCLWLCCFQLPEILLRFHDHPSGSWVAWYHICGWLMYIKILYSKVVIYRVVISFTSSIANVSTMLCFYGYHYDITFIGPSKLFC